MMGQQESSWVADRLGDEEDRPREAEFRRRVLAHESVIVDWTRHHDDRPDGVREAVVSKHHSDDYSVDALDDELTRCGDGGIDLQIGGVPVDVKTVRYGYAKGRTPLLKVRQVKHEENMHRLEDGDLDALMYYLVEHVSDTTARLIGYIDAEVFDEVCKEIAEGETYKPDDPQYDWTSRDDNYFAEPQSLWLSYRDD